METPQRFVRHDVGRCGRGIARDDQPVPDECLTEEAHDNNDQVQHTADSCVKLWRCLNATRCHFCFSLGMGIPRFENRETWGTPLAEPLMVTLYSYPGVLSSRAMITIPLLH